MKPTTANGLVLGLLSCAFLALGAACTLPTSGILYGLENEVPIDNIKHGIPKDCSSNQMATHGDAYVTLMGTTLYATKIPDADAATGVGGASGAWTALPRPDANANLAATALAADSSWVYAIFASNAGNNSTLPKLYRTSFNAATIAGAVWSAVDLSSQASQIPTSLFGTASGTVLLQTVGTGDYSLFRLASGSLGTKFNWTSGNNRPVLALAGPDSATVVATAGGLYTSDILAAAPALAPLAGPSQSVKNFSALAWDGNTTAPAYYLASSTGYLAKFANGVWTTSGSVQSITGKTTALSFSALVFIGSGFKDKAGKASIAATGQLLAATVGSGLFLVNQADTTVVQQPAVREGDFLWGANYSSSDLGSVSHIFQGSNNTLFLGTFAKGLWSCQYNSDYTINASTTPKNGLVFTWE